MFLMKWRLETTEVGCLSPIVKLKLKAFPFLIGTLMTMLIVFIESDMNADLKKPYEDKHSKYF